MKNEDYQNGYNDGYKAATEGLPQLIEPKVIIPDGKTNFSQYNYTIECPLCDWNDNSDKGMTGIEQNYVKHYLNKHHDRYQPFQGESL